MTIDLTSIPATTREEQIQIGRHYSSRDTLAQANKTLLALDSYASVLANEGFVATDVARLTAARDMLVAAGVGRETARTGKKMTSRASTQARKTAKAKRLRARSILENTASALAESPDPSAQEAVRAIRATLEQTQGVEEDAEKLATQLDQLSSTLSQPSVSAEAGNRGGTQAITDLGVSAQTLRGVDQQGATAAGTPAETQLLDHLDGIIVGLTRRAQKAARSASKQLGDPAIVAAFRLSKLYRSGSRRASEAPESSPQAKGR